MDVFAWFGALDADAKLVLTFAAIGAALTLWLGWEMLRPMEDERDVEHGTPPAPLWPTADRKRDDTRRPPFGPGAPARIPRWNNVTDTLPVRAVK